MRNLFFLVLFLIALNSCKTPAYFHSPNDIFKSPATVYLLDGTEKKAAITILFETGQDAGKFISINNGSKEDKIPVDSIKSYSMGADYYYPKIIDLDFNGSKKLLFVKRLTKENSRIQLYELFQQHSLTSDGTEQVMYFLSLPSHPRLEAWNAGSTKFVPDFDEKMAKLVEDCPALSGRIKAKEKGYFISQVTLSNQKKVSVFTKIIDEYNNCR